MPAPTIDDLYTANAHLAGQLAATTNLVAALAALHPEDRETFERVVIRHRGATHGYTQAGSATAESTYTDVCSAPQCQGLANEIRLPQGHGVVGPL